jgi:hypothetical protein
MHPENQPFLDLPFFIHCHLFARTGQHPGTTTLHRRVADQASLTGGLGA